MRWQIATSDYVNEVMEIAEASPMHTSSMIDHARQELVIVGVGEPPEALANVMKRAPENIRVTWQKAPYTLAELTAELLRILNEQPKRFHGGGLRHDGTGIRLSSTDAGLLAEPDPQAILGARYPVTIEYGGPATPV